MKVFVDTSYYLASMARYDRCYQKTLQPIHPEIRLVTSSMVLNETVSLLQARGILATALHFLEATRSNPAIQIVYVDPGLLAVAWSLFHTWGGLGATVVDCTSFAIMRRLGIRKAFTFDQRFRTAGFEILE